MNTRFVSIIAWTGFAAVSIAVMYASVMGRFSIDGARLVQNPWGLATLIDIYVGFALFSCWVFWRETRLDRALLWIVLFLIAGNIATTIYVLIALHRSRGSVEAFWLGPNWRKQKTSGED